MSILAGIEKFGLTDTPHAVAAAQYHYLSNQIGGVNVEYMRESDRKARIRYPPRAGSGAARRSAPFPAKSPPECCAGGMPITASHSSAHGLVCTKQTVDGQNGLEGFYYEYDRDLLPEERLVFARHLEAQRSIPQPHRNSRAIPGRAHGWKRPIAIMRWSMCAPRCR
jgi:hypothetical protein